MAPIQENVAELSNGARYTYLDTGVPKGASDYRTVIFVHGTAHNKCSSPSLVQTIDASYVPTMPSGHTQRIPWDFYVSTWDERLDPILNRRSRMQSYAKSIA